MFPNSDTRSFVPLQVQQGALIVASIVAGCVLLTRLMPNRLDSLFGGNFEKKQRSNQNGRIANGTTANGSTANGHFDTELVNHGYQGSDEHCNIKDTLNQYSQLIHAAKRPLPNRHETESSSHDEGFSGITADLARLGFRDVKTLAAVMTKSSGDLVDDRKYLMEYVIQLVADLPTRSKTRMTLTNAFVDELWNSLQHPPLSYLGKDYVYRQADGSYNNIMFPHIGAANTPYARSVRPVITQPGALPDPGLIFDSVFCRKEFKPHPNRVSSVFFYWASIIIHDLFDSDFRDMNVSKTSSYLDLSPLYGDNEEEQREVRTFKDGKLKPDCWAERRLLGVPPGCSVLMIMLNRFHNYVVEQLAAINEDGRFTKPRSGLPFETTIEAWQKYDNDLFQTGRLITCGLYINITLMDYLRTIVNLNRSNTTWTLDPRVEIDKLFGEDGTPRGVGNQVSVEFNLAYRWHSAMSDRDDKWTQDAFKKIFDKSADHISMVELLQGLKRWDQSLPEDPLQRPFAGLERQLDGKYNDDDLVQILTESIEDVAGSFGANNVPLVMRSVEILGMEQARKWNCATLNEFRKFFGLKAYDTFEEINPDPQVADQLRNLYEHPDYVEIYPGLVAEDAKKPMVPGVGIAPTYTISRAVLSDAVALVRGDRFYTIDYHPKNLTNWGYQEVDYDLNVEQGCVISKLFLRAFPNHFKPNSIYAHYPMTVPSENREIMKTLGREHHYSYDRPERIPPRVNLFSYVGTKYVLENSEDFRVCWGEATGFCMGKGGFDFMLSGDGPFFSRQRQVMCQALYKDQWQQHVKAFYEYITLKLLHEKSCKIGGINQVDITRELTRSWGGNSSVGNLAHVHFASSIFSLPLKTADSPHGVYTEHELYMVIALCFTCIFFDVDPAKSFSLRQAARETTQQLGKLVETQIKATELMGSVAGKVSNMMGFTARNDGPLRVYGEQMIRGLLQSGLGAQEIAWSQVLPTAVAMVPNQAQVFTQILDYYLTPENVHHLKEINRIAKLDTPEVDELLLRYAMEAIRLHGTFGSYRDATKAMSIDDGNREVSVKPGDRVFVSFVSANRDPVVFPDPDTVRLDRPLSSYIHYGIGPHTCLGADVSKVALTAMLKVVGRLDNLRRAPGPQGQLKKIPRPGGFYMYMAADHGSYFPFPLTMKVNWDGELPPLESV